MALLLSPLLHGNIFTKSYKTQMLIWQLSLKAQIIIWQLFLQKPKSILATITKTITLFWQKQLLYAQSLNVNLAPILQSPSINLATIS